MRASASRFETQMRMRTRGLLSASFREWCELHIHSKRDRQTERHLDCRSFRHSLHRKQRRVWYAWQAEAKHAKILRRMCAKTIWNLRCASVRRVWREWFCCVVGTRRFNRMVRRLRSRFSVLRLSTLSDALDQWHFRVSFAREEQQFVTAQRAQQLRRACAQYGARKRTLRDGMLALSAWMLLCLLAKLARRRKTEAAAEAFAWWCARCLRRKCVACVLGSWDFMHVHVTVHRAFYRWYMSVFRLCLLYVCV